MNDTIDDVHSIGQLREFIHLELCDRENLLADQFTMSEMLLVKRQRVCGIQFSLHGPRSVRLGAIWDADHNHVYFYDGNGMRFRKARLRHRIGGDWNERSVA